MAEQPPKARDEDKSSRTDADTRKYAMLLSGLALTPDSALELFRDRRAANPKLDVARLKRARDLLDAIGAAITHGDEKRWERVDEAWRLLAQGDEAPADAEAKETPAPAPAADAAEPPRLDRPAPVDAPPPVHAKPPAPIDAPSLVASAPLASAPGKASPWARAASSPAPAMPAISAVTPAPIAPPAASSALPAILTGVPPPIVPYAAAARDPRNAVSTTAEIPALALEGVAPPGLDRCVLPFQPPDDSPPSSDDGDAPPPRPFVTPFERARGADDANTTSDGTDAGNTLESSDPRPPSTPFSKTGAQPPALAAHLAAIDVDQYAALCAQCTLYPGWITQILARFGIASPAEQARLDEHWRARLAADQELQAVWRWHYARHEAWVRQRK
jgi:hypothetical protein